MAQQRRENPSANATQKGRQAIMSVKDFSHWMEKFEPQFARVIDTHVMKPDRLVGLAVTAYADNSYLQNCSVITIANSLMYAAQLSLEVNTPLGQSYLVPYAGVCTLQLGYRGLTTLAYRSGKVHSIDAHEVREADEFVYRYGTNAELVHVPAFGKGQLTEMIGAYMILEYREGGRPYFHVMSAPEIEQVRARAQGAWERNKVTKERTGNLTGPWKDWDSEMWRKTPVKRGLKLCELSPAIQQAVGLDDIAELGKRQPRIIDLPQDQFTRGDADELKHQDDTAGADGAGDAPPVDNAKLLSRDAFGPLSWANFTPEETERVTVYFRQARNMNGAQTEAALGRWNATKGDLLDMLVEWEKSNPPAQNKGGRK